MSELAILERPAAASDEDSAKRRQIVSGARAVFLSQGFDAASMNDIARAAGVSKGTLYVYFKDKEQLFEAIVEQECETQAEGIFDFDPDDHDVEAVLTRLGFGYIRFLCRPEKASAIRVVIAIAERMPELGRKILRARPRQGHREARRLHQGASRRRRSRGGGLRGRCRATHRGVSSNAVQIDGVQFRARAERRADRACRAYRGEGFSRRLSGAERLEP